MSHRKAQPFVKWAGGKKGILEQLHAHLPQKFVHYYEPFFGGGALFFSLLPKKAFLSDLNPRLCNLYEQVRDRLDALLPLLDQHAQAHNHQYYYKMRQCFNEKQLSSLEEAALFLYLNKSCYNGLYRLNGSGCFNTPIGSYKNINIYNEANIRSCSLLLRNAELTCQSYKQIKPNKGDFVYFDPPYHNNFNSYNKIGFGESEQRCLADFCTQLHKKGVHFLLSNSDSALIQQLYQKFNISYIVAPRSLNSDGGARKAQELLIYNYSKPSKKENAMSLSSGGKANLSGKNFENFVANQLELHGYRLVSQSDFKEENFRQTPLFTRQYRFGTTIYERPWLCDFALYHPQKFPQLLFIECKWQSSSGSVDQKYPFLVENIKKNRIKTLILLGGSGYRKEAENWLVAKAQLSEGLFEVCNTDQILNKFNTGYF